MGLGVRPGFKSQLCYVYLCDLGTSCNPWASVSSSVNGGGLIIDPDSGMG